jgi:formate dehydrogenase subunit delta
MSTIDKLVMMANQIALNLAHEPKPAAAAAQHIRLFWTPQMREQIETYCVAGGAGLNQLARDAIACLAE